MSKNDEYFTTMEAQIKKWDAEADKLRARSHEMSAEARAKYEEQNQGHACQPRCRAREVARDARGQ